eukprot:scaffold11094_cov135-Isochrysis_galbana.AAC.5
MGDPALYPEIRTARFLYAMQWLPRDFIADYQARQQWIDNNLTYLDGLVIANLHYNDADFRRGTWAVYHNLHMCRLGVCPNWLWDPPPKIPPRLRDRWECLQVTVVCTIPSPTARAHVILLRKRINLTSTPI